MRRAAATVGPLPELAATAGYRVEPAASFPCCATCWPSAQNTKQAPDQLRPARGNKVGAGPTASQRGPAPDLLVLS